MIRRPLLTLSDASGVSTTRSVAHSKMFVELKVEEENMAYNFTIQAVTVKGAGEPATVTYKSGPHTGMPTDMSIWQCFYI